VGWSRYLCAPQKTCNASYVTSLTTSQNYYNYVSENLLLSCWYYPFPRGRTQHVGCVHRLRDKPVLSSDSRGFVICRVMTNNHFDGR